MQDAIGYARCDTSVFGFATAISLLFRPSYAHSMSPIDIL